MSPQSLIGVVGIDIALSELLQNTVVSCCFLVTLLYHKQMLGKLIEHKLLIAVVRSRGTVVHFRDRNRKRSNFGSSPAPRAKGNSGRACGDHHQ